MAVLVKVMAFFARCLHNVFDIARWPLGGAWCPQGFARGFWVILKGHKFDVFGKLKKSVYMYCPLSSRRQEGEFGEILPHSRAYYAILTFTKNTLIYPQVQCDSILVRFKP